MEKQDEQIFVNRIKELYNRAYLGNIYTFSDFMGQSELDVFFSQCTKGIAQDYYTLYGGHESAERVMVRFGSEAGFGYEVEFPIKCIKVEPTAPKFAKTYSHRDFLGSLMGLGMERKLFGDIVIDGLTAYIFAQEKAADYVVANLDSVGRNPVKCSLVDNLPDNISKGARQELLVQCASMRADAVIAKTYNLSRKDVLPYFFEKRVAVNGRTVENNDKLLQLGDIVSVRGCGKFEIGSIGALSKKGKQNITVSKYV